MNHCDTHSAKTKKTDSFYKAGEIEKRVGATETVKERERERAESRGRSRGKGQGRGGGRGKGGNREDAGGT
eukprot:1945669-Prorocentrum_lima.AAC.1